MAERFLKKIIAQNEEDLRVISALCSESKIKQAERHLMIIEGLAGRYHL